MSQNSARLSWTFEEVDAKLKDIMENIFRTVSDTAMEYGLGKNYMPEQILQASSRLLIP